MDQADVKSDGLTRQARVAYRRLVRASVPGTEVRTQDSDDRTLQIAEVKKHLRVEARLQRTASWAARPLYRAALHSRLAALLGAQFSPPSKQRPVQRPPPEV